MVDPTRAWAEAVALEQLELGSKKPWDIKTEPTTVRERYKADLAR